MSIEVLTADTNGTENVQRWAAMGLPVPPSWRIHRDVLDTHPDEALVAQLRALPRMFSAERYWVLQQGPMNARSQRESLLNLDSDDALAAALRSIFSRGEAEQVVIQALPEQQAAGVLFTRHPLRQDLNHMVVEGVVAHGEQRQRLIYDQDGHLVHHPESVADGEKALQQQVCDQHFFTLQQKLKQHFPHPQAAEWVFDGKQLWLLQTLPTGSLPVPRQVWSRRGSAELFSQGVTPLWYTLQGRWLKTAYWQPLIKREGLDELDKIEPYRRQHSHIYSNCQFFRAMQSRRPALARQLPPAWQPLQPAAAKQARLALTAGLDHYRRRLALQRLTVAVEGWRLHNYSRDGLWQGLMRLDRIGERLAAVEGELLYQALPGLLCEQQQPLPLSLLCSSEEQQLLLAALRNDRQRIEDSPLRPGDDPVHAPLSAAPPQSNNLGGADDQRQLQEPAAADELRRPLQQRLVQRRQARILRYQLANRCRDVLTAMAALLIREGLLGHPDDIYFFYFDELWSLWMDGSVPASASAEKLAQRKLRYLEDCHQGAPDWMIDQVGYGFGGGQQLSPLLRGRTLVAGTATGPLRRICSAWNLNQITPRDIVVVDQVEPAWLPWLGQAAGLVIAERDVGNAAASLAVALSIPAIWGVSDVMHSVRDGLVAVLDAEQGSLQLEQPEG